MIEKEFFETREDGVKLYRTFSTEAKKIKKVGTDEIYDEAIDVEDAPYEYEETAEQIDEAEEKTEDFNSDVIAPVISTESTESAESTEE